MDLTQEELHNKVALLGCCYGDLALQTLKAEQYNSPDFKCLTGKMKYLNRAIEILDDYTVVGTILEYDLQVCSDINLSGFVSYLQDDLTISVVINTSTGPVTIVTFIGDFAGFTLSQFIDALVLEINTNAPVEYTATNMSPNIRICFTGTSAINLLGLAISIQIAPYYFLKWTETNARRSGATTWGYGAITAARPCFVGTTDAGIVFNKLYVPNGDLITYIDPSIQKGTEARSWDLAVPYSTTPVVYNSTFATGLSPSFFVIGQEFGWTTSVTDFSAGIGQTYCTGALTGAPYVNTYYIRVEIVASAGAPTGYNTATGYCSYIILDITWQSVSIAQMPAITQVYNIPCTPPSTTTPLGTTGGTPIGVKSWQFDACELAWSTVSIYDCDLVTGNLTWKYDLEVNTHFSKESSFDGKYVYISGFGADNQASAVVAIDPLTDTQTAVVDLGITGNVGLMWNDQKGNNYVYSGNFLSKVGIAPALNYDGPDPPLTGDLNTSNVFLNSALGNLLAGAVTFGPTGDVYVAPTGVNNLVVSHMPDPSPTYNLQDPNPTVLFTALDNTVGAPSALGICPKDYNSLGTLTNLTGQQLLIGGGLDIYNLIWVAGATFVITYTDTSVLPNIRYTISCTIESYVNTPPGLLTYTIDTITATNVTTGVITPLSSFPLVGSYCWAWSNYPLIKGAISMHYHISTKKLFIGRYTNVGGLLQSYDLNPLNVNLLDPLAIDATRVNYFHPDFPNTQLSGQINYQSIEDKFFCPTSATALQETWVFDPNTTSWDLKPITHPADPVPPLPPPIPDTTTGGIQKLSYTADETLRGVPNGINIYGTTYAGNEISVISYQEPVDNEFFGVFDGEVTEVVTTDADNCLDEDEVDNILENSSGICCSCCQSSSDIISDIL